MPDAVLDAIERLREEVRQLREEVRTRRLGDPEELLTAEQAAKLLKVTPGAIRQAARRKALNAVRVGRWLRFRRGELVRK